MTPVVTYFSSYFMALPLLIQEEKDKALAPGFEAAHGEYRGMGFIMFGTRIGIPLYLRARLIRRYRAIDTALIL